MSAISLFICLFIFSFSILNFGREKVGFFPAIGFTLLGESVIFGTIILVGSQTKDHILIGLILIAIPLTIFPILEIFYDLKEWITKR